jgi:hypothetical protein
VARRIPTEIGDVLILRTTRSYTIHAVGRVSKAGQQDLGSEANVKHEIAYAAAVVQAKTMVGPGRRIFFRDIDIDEWSEISH